MDERTCDKCGHVECRAARERFGWTDNSAEYTVEVHGITWRRICPQYRPQIQEENNNG